MANVYTTNFNVCSHSLMVSVLQRDRLCWCGHVLQGGGDWVRRCVEYGVRVPDHGVDQEGAWTEVVQKDCWTCRLNGTHAIGCYGRRKLIKDDL